MTSWKTRCSSSESLPCCCLERGERVAVELALLGQALQLLERDRPLVDDRQDLRPGHRPDLHLHEGEPGRPGPCCSKPRISSCCLALEVLEGELEALLELLALEQPREALGELAQQPVQAVAEDGAAPGGQAQQPGLLRAGEVVDVEQVVGRRALGRRAGRRCSSMAVMRAGAGQAGDEDVEARASRSARPNSRARTARAWPMIPCDGSILAVESAGSHSSGHRHRRS